MFLRFIKITPAVLLKNTSVNMNLRQRNYHSWALRVEMETSSSLMEPRHYNTTDANSIKSTFKPPTLLVQNANPVLKTLVHRIHRQQSVFIVVFSGIQLWKQTKNTCGLITRYQATSHTPSL